MEKGGVVEKSPTKAGLGLLWNLNFRTMPTALFWALSLLVSLEVNSLLLRIIAITSCGLASILSSHLIRRKVRPGLKYSLVTAFRDSTAWGWLGLTGMIYGLSLENISSYTGSTPLVRLFYVANFVTSLILWFFVQIVVLPIRMIGETNQPTSVTLRSSLLYLKDKRGAIAISFLALMLGWVLFFFYFLLALTFAQAVTYGVYDIDRRTKIGD